MPQFTKKEKSTKSLTINLFDRNAPDYEFIGDWAGRDVKVVGRTLARAYRKHVLAIRRKLHPDMIEPVISEINPTTDVVLTPEA